MVLIDKAALLNKIAKEVHYDSEHSLETYAKMLSLINDAPDGVVRCKECKYASMTYDGECKYCQRWKEKYDGESVSLYLDGDFYCAWGERREDAKTD